MAERKSQRRRMVAPPFAWKPNRERPRVSRRGSSVLKLADILIAHSLATPADILEALENQRLGGGSLGDCLVRLGRLRAEDLERVVGMAPRSPQSIDDTGLTVA